MTLGYLDLVDGLLGVGAAAFSDRLRQAQVDYLAGLQQPDGGFPGRRGASDLYYTDFALRTLCALAPDHPALPGAASYVTRVAPAAQGVVHVFSALNACRLLSRLGLAPAVAGAALRQKVLGLAAPGGGFRRTLTGEPSAYATFIAALCHEILEEPLPGQAEAVGAVMSLRDDSGGFRALLRDGHAQTSATAAAVGFLALGDALSPQVRDAACRFLAGMQAPGGGLRAHAQAPSADLLSTFTGLVTLALTDGVAAVDLPAAGRFVRDLLEPGGGFRGSSADAEPDVEYTYYGLGCLAVLRAAAWQ